MQGIYCNIYDLPAEENVSKRSLNHAYKPLTPCPLQQKDAANGCGLNERIHHGLQDESGGYEAQGGVLGMPSVTIELPGDVVGSSKKHQ